MRYDVVIVGGGSAGCTLATRLSEDPNRSVILLEAGPDYADLEQLPDELKFGHRQDASDIDSLLVVVQVKFIGLHLCRFVELRSRDAPFLDVNQSFCRERLDRRMGASDRGENLLL